MAQGTVAARMTESMRAYWGSYGASAGRVCETDGDATLVWSGIPHPVINLVILERHDPAATGRVLARMRGLIARHGIGATWHVAPEAEAEGAEAALTGAGLIRSGEMTAMLCRLDGVSPPPSPQGLEIREMHGAPERRIWGAVTGEAFGFDAACTAAFAACEAAIPEARLRDQIRYLGLFGGKPVAVSSLVMSAGYAGIYAVAALPAARQQGIGAAMTAHAMTAGRDRGAAEAVLQATDMGFPVYRRLGFERVFGLRHYSQPAAA